MAKVSFASLKLKTDKSTHIMKFNDAEIEVVNYLPVEDLNEIVAATLHKSLENGVYNPLKVEVYKLLHSVYMCTNLSFTDKQLEDEGKLYDALASSGFVDAFLQDLDENNRGYYKDVTFFINKAIEKNEKYNKTIASVIHNFINNVPLNTEKAADIIKNFDPEQFKNVIDFARAANGGRDIEQ